ncbi:MAG: CCA tRNA nucleotidyltransferase [Rhodospirillales bacterium]|nr:MAG: CCA tRNA nucleotidyltransferase [Rhodospirillales bacterium]
MAGSCRRKFGDVADRVGAPRLGLPVTEERRQERAAPPLGPVGSIAAQPWMTARESRAVVTALAVGGTEVRFIGGCVRDAIIKRPVRDIDIAVPLPPDRVMQLLTGAGIKVIPTGIEHGTVTAVVGPGVFEITSLRVDVETYGRHARVAFTDDWQADAARRDFTINALSATPDGTVYDYFGGLEDLSHGRVRFVGSPGARIQEDRLRLLRFFRFYAHYGRPPPDEEALAACREHARGLNVLSGERVRVEIFRTLMAPDPADVFQLMQGLGVLAHVLPEARSVGRLRIMSWLDSRAIRLESVKPEPVRRLAALIETDAAGAAAIAERLRLSCAQSARLETMAAAAWDVSPDAGGRALRRALHRLGRDGVRDLLLLQWSGERAINPRLGAGRTAEWIDQLHAVDAWQPVPFPLRGRDALALGVPAGPAVGAALKAVETWWEEEDYCPDYNACLERLKAVVEAGTQSSNGPS